MYVYDVTQDIEKILNLINIRLVLGTINWF